MNKEVPNHLQYKWWVYLLTAVLIVVLWLTVFGILAKPKATEKIGITFVGTEFNSAALEADLPEIIKNISQQEIKQVNVESVVEENVFTLDNILVARSQGVTDLFIWKGELKAGIEDRYAVLDEQIVTAALGDVTFHRVNGEAFAILLDGANFSKYYSGSEQCWLLVSVNSVNFGGANGVGSSENDAALMIVKYLLGDE